MWMTLLFFGIGVAFFWVLYLLLKHSTKATETMLGVSSTVIQALQKIVSVFDKKPEEESLVEKLLKYAEIAVASVEQSYKFTKEEMKKMLEDGKITEEEMQRIYADMKTDAINIAKQLLEADGYQVGGTEMNILSYIIEAMVLFLPKSGLAKSIEKD